MSTKVTILNETNTIGGNVVSFETDNSRIIMDFGLSFSPSKNNANGDNDEVILPNVPDLFTNKKVNDKQTAIFISHLHLDHMGALKFLAKKVPVYMSEQSAKLYHSLIDNGVEENPVNAEIKTVKPGENVSVGDLSVQVFETDHDIVGALMIEVSDGKHTFVHSGDVRYDGPHPERVDKWTHYLKENKPSLFFIEGTEFSFPKSGQRRTEMSVAQDIKDLSTSSDKLIVVNPYERNIDRLQGLIQVANDSNRTMVWDSVYASILKDMGVDGVKALDDDVSLQEIIDNPGNYILQNHYNRLITLNHLDNFEYIHLNGEPLGEYDPRFAKLKEYFKGKRIEMKVSGASGHAIPEDLIKIAKTVDATMTIPWHSFKPEVEHEAFVSEGINSRLSYKGESFVFE